MSTKLNLLVIDDVNLVRTFVRKGLHTFIPNIEVIEAVNGRHAQKILLSNHIDIILCDWEMPEVNGRDFVVWLRNEDKFRKVPIIMVTGRNDRKDVVDAMRAGIDGYVIKPFNIENLASRIKEVLIKYGINFEPPPVNSEPPINESVAILTGGKNKEHSFAN